MNNSLRDIIFSIESHLRNLPEQTLRDALAYLNLVNGKFGADQMEKYEEFLQILEDFKTKRIGTLHLIERLKELFKGHDDLILGFNVFLPKGYKIVFASKKPIKFIDSIMFVEKVKNRLISDQYVCFLRILSSYKKGTKSLVDVYEDGVSLFKDYPDLMSEFAHFIPDDGISTNASKG